MNIKVQQISPAEATKMLARQRPNRRLNRRLVAHLAKEISAGRWHLTHQGIAFDEAGFLVDGQHRLHAIAVSAIGVPMCVTHGVPVRSVIDAVDQGVKRTAGQLGEMRGETNASEKAAVGRLVSLLMSVDTEVNERISPALIWNTVESWRMEIELFVGTSGGNNLGLRMTAGMLAPLVVMARSSCRDLAVAIRDGLVVGSGLETESPMLLLRNHFIARRKERGFIQFDQMGKVIAVADLMMGNELVKRVTASGIRYRSWCRRLGIEVNPYLERQLSQTKVGDSGDR